jgi:hypothetical protein
MVAPAQPDGPRQRPSLGARILGLALGFIAVVFTVASLLRVADGVTAVLQLIGDKRSFDGWVLLILVVGLLALVGIIGTWRNLRRRAYVWTLFFLLLQMPGPFVIEANQCDVMPTCEWEAWALLPPAFFEWRLKAL